MSCICLTGRITVSSLLSELVVGRLTLRGGEGPAEMPLLGPFWFRGSVGAGELLLLLLSRWREILKDFCKRESQNSALGLAPPLLGRLAPFEA